MQSREVRLRLGIGFALLFGLAARTAVAEGIDAQTFKPAFSSSGYLTQESPRVLGHLVPNIALTLDYGRELLVARDPSTGQTLGGESLLAGRLSAHVTAAVGLWDRAEIGLRVPMALQQSGSFEGLGAAGSPRSTALGDVALAGKVRLLGPGGHEPGFRLTATLALSLPTGSEEDFTGMGTFAVRPGLLAGGDWGPLSTALGVGYLARGQSRLAGLTVDDEIEAGLAAMVALVPHALWLVGELWGRAAVQADSSASTTPVEADAGLRLAIWGPWLAQLGMGTGLTDGYGTPKLRGILAIAYAPTGERDAPEPGPPPAVEIADQDGDTIPDNIDRCPMQAEDPDQFEDNDGCPEPDNDGDGVLDGRDACPNEPEDKDGIQDSDGCPELDNDHDGIPDGKDACPDRAEDFDDFQDGDGCPELDNDGDGIPDIRDKCPNQPEIFNGNADDDGCPDAGAVLVELTKEKLVIKQEVKFQTNRAKVKPDSYQLLATVAKMMVLHPEITLVRVEGHTDSRGKRARNLKLSQARAEAVCKHLVEVNGIDGNRLRAVGYGPDRSVASNSTRQGRALNRRVEFVIVAQ